MIKSRDFKKISSIIFFCLSLVFSIFRLWQYSGETRVQGEQQSSEKEQVLVTRVIDGDTFELSDGRKVRYIGIDTPETKHPQKPVECFGLEASEFNENLILNKQVFLESDVQDQDRYGRLLRYVWIGDELINETLVKQGYANASSYPPNVKYQDLFVEAQQQAIQNNMGLWEKCEVNDVETINEFLDEVD